jgi:hypothetical protein
MMPLLGSSQTHLTDSICCVSCKALKNALLVKNERDYLKQQNGILQDSTKLQTIIINHQKNIIDIDSIKIYEYINKENTYNSIIHNKDKEIDIYIKKYNTERSYKRITLGISVGLVITLLIIL